MLYVTPATTVRTYRYRVRDKHAKWLGRMARTVNFVWNYCNDTQRTAVQRGDRWPSHYDLCSLTTGTSTDLDLPAMTIEAVCKRYVTSRRGAHRRHLRYRGKRSLAWVPFRAENLLRRGDGFAFRRKRLGLWMDRPLPEGAKIRDGSSFSCDARGRWYLNIVTEHPSVERVNLGPAVGIDLGLKSIVTLSTGEAIAAPQHFRRGAERYAKAQRAGKKRLAATASAKIANQRRDFLHKLSARIVREHSAVYVGDVSARRLVKTRMAKSVLDAGWSSFRWMLSYKAIAQGAVYREVNEAGSTVTCSDCGWVGGPRGREGLVVRLWTCSSCGVEHDRDVNAARNIARMASHAPTGACIAQHYGRLDCRSAAISET